MLTVSLNFITLYLIGGGVARSWVSLNFITLYLIGGGVERSWCTFLCYSISVWLFVF